MTPWGILWRGFVGSLMIYGMAVIFLGEMGF